MVAAEAWIAEVLAKDVLLRGSADPFPVVMALGAQALVVADDGAVSATPGLTAFLGAAGLPARLDARVGRSA